MKIGFPNNPRKDILEEIEWIGKNGFDFVDLFLEEDRAVPGKIDVGKVKNLIQRHGLGVVGHMGWYLPIGSPAKAFREAAVSEARRYLGVFSRLGVKHVTVHSNWPPGMFSAKEGIDFQVETLKKLVGEAKRHGLGIMYEPIDTLQDGMENVSEILGRVPGLSLHIDIGHASLFGREPGQFIRKFHKKLRHIHLHDNNGSEDLHLPMGTGKIDWKGVVKTLKRYYDGTITLEIFSRDRDYVLLSRDKLRKLWRQS